MIGETGSCSMIGVNPILHLHGIPMLQVPSPGYVTRCLLETSPGSPTYMQTYLYIKCLLPDVFLAYL